MSVPRQILQYRSGSEYLASQINESATVKPSSAYEKIIIDIFLRNVFLILQSNIENMEDEFVRQLPTFGSKMEKLSLSLKSGDAKKILKYITSAYSAFEKGISRDKVERTHKEGILEILRVLKDFDNVYLGIYMKRRAFLRETLKELKSSGNLGDFETSRNGTILAFFCMLPYIQKNVGENQKLSKLFEIGRKYSSKLEGWTDSIDIMSNPKEADQLKKAEAYFQKLR